MNQPENAVDHINLAIRLSPNDPILWAFYGYSGLAHFALGDLDTAIEQLEQCYQLAGAQFNPFVWLAVCYLQAGREEAAREALAHAQKLEPNLSIGFLSKIYSNREGRRTKQLLEAMEKLGLEA
jgi:Flp pilus assembly protein TadD